MAIKIKQGDKVMAIAGRDKNKKGKVIRIIGKEALVEGVNMVKKHVKPNPNLNQAGGILEREAVIHLSNLALVDPTGKATRVGFKTLEDGKKVRYFKSNGELVDV
ncbi:MAG: 50S ribosomal protein L24 [Gammaproteobacteria bacterium]